MRPDDPMRMAAVGAMSVQELDTGRAEAFAGRVLGIVNDGMLPMNNPSVEALEDFVKAEIMRWGAVVRRVKSATERFTARTNAACAGTEKRR